MAKKMYIGDTASKARKIKKGYLGDTDSKARKVKKGYIGVGGVARPFMSGELAYYGQIDGLSKAVCDLVATTVGDTALFAGGNYYDTNRYTTGISTINCYSSNLVKSSNISLSQARGEAAAVTLGNYAMIGGGVYCSKGSTTYRGNVEVFDDTLVSVKTIGVAVGGNNTAATTVGNTAIFVQGLQSNTSGYLQYISSDLIASQGAYYSSTAHNATAASVGDYAIICGGYYNWRKATVIDADLVSSSITLLQSSHEDMFGMKATTVGDYALMAGGFSDSAYKVVYAVNSELVVTMAPELTSARKWLAAVTLGDNALFAGGYNNSKPYPSDVVDVYDPTLVKQISHTLSVARYGLAATTVGDYAIIAGGDTGSLSPTNTVEAFVI